MMESQREVIVRSSEKTYNSYLLLYKLNELKIDNGKLLQEVISKAINEGNAEVEFKIKNAQYKIKITTEKNRYKLEVLGEYTKPEVKDILEYTDGDIIALWAESKVFLEKDSNNGYAFAVNIEAEQKELKVGGLGKKIPFSLRFANFYKVIEILKDKEKPLEERLRIANNIATGSGKTGDIAFFKLWAYLCDIPCITMVPSDTLKNQSIKFDEEFLPDEVAQKFAQPFSEGNSQYTTTTFREALDVNWNVLNSIYGKENEKLALICIDEAPKLRENPVLLARAIEISCSNPVAIFSAVPDGFLSDKFKITTQILLSPKERAALGIGKLPAIHFHKIKFKTPQEMGSAHAQGKSKYEWRFVDPVIAYTEKSENTHTRLDKYEDAVAKFKAEIEERNNDLSGLSQPFLNFVNQSLDSQAYKAGLIGTEERWERNIINYITKVDAKKRNQKRIKSFVKAIKNLGTRLMDDDIEFLVKENLNVKVGSELFPSIKLHNILDTLNEYRSSGGTADEGKISKFIDKKYGITDSCSLKLNSELTNAILTLCEYQDHRESIERNYPGDKALHEYIFNKFPKIKIFCEQDAVICYFNGRVKRFESNREEYISDGEKENILGMVKAGFVPNAISKELALGIDAPRLNRAL